MQVAEETQSQCCDNEELVNEPPTPNFKHKKYLKTKFEIEKHKIMKKPAGQPSSIQAELPLPVINIKQENVDDEYVGTAEASEFDQSEKLKNATGTSSTELDSSSVPPPMPPNPPPPMPPNPPPPPNTPPASKNIKKEKENDEYECSATEFNQSELREAIARSSAELDSLLNVPPPDKPSVRMNLTEYSDTDENSCGTNESTSEFEHTEELESNAITNTDQSKEKPIVKIKNSEGATRKLLQGASAFCSDFQNSVCATTNCKFIHATEIEMENYFKTQYLPSHTLFHLRRDSVLQPPLPPPQIEEAPNSPPNNNNLQGNKNVEYATTKTSNDCNHSELTSNAITKTNQSAENSSVEKCPMFEVFYRTGYLPPDAIAHLKEVSALPPPPPPPQPEEAASDHEDKSGSTRTTQFNQPEKLSEANGTLGTDQSENRQAETMCRDFVRGACKQGAACLYTHKIILSQLPDVYTFCRNFQNYSMCLARNCKFVHATVSEEDHFYRTGNLPPQAKLHRIENPENPSSARLLTEEAPPMINNVIQTIEDITTHTNETSEFNQTEKPKEATETIISNDQSDNTTSTINRDTKTTETMCRNFIRGTCTKGASCIYVHKLIIAQLPGVYIFCKHFQKTGCPIPYCKFVHGTVLEEEHFYKTGYVPPHTIAHLKKTFLKFRPSTPLSEETPSIGDIESSFEATETIETNQTEEIPKTMCRDFVRGTCDKGTACIFAHKIILAQLPVVYLFCPQFQNSVCRKPQCKFVHATVEEIEHFYRTGNLPAHTQFHLKETYVPPPSPPPQKFEDDKDVSPLKSTIIMCRNFVRGTCRKGAKCVFAHKIIVSQLPGVYTFCKDFQNSACSGPYCKFVHASVFEREHFYRTGFLPSHTTAHLLENKASSLPPPLRVEERPVAPPAVYYKAPPPPPPSGVKHKDVRYNAEADGKRRANPDVISIQPYTKTNSQNREWRAIDKEAAPPAVYYNVPPPPPPSGVPPVAVRYDARAGGRRTNPDIFSVQPYRNTTPQNREWRAVDKEAPVVPPTVYYSTPPPTPSSCVPPVAGRYDARVGGRRTNPDIFRVQPFRNTSPQNREWRAVDKEGPPLQPRAYYNVPPPPPSSGTPAMAPGYIAEAGGIRRANPDVFGIHPYANNISLKRDWGAINEVSSSASHHDSGSPQPKKCKINYVIEFSDEELVARIEQARHILAARGMQNGNQGDIITFMLASGLITDIPPGLSTMLAVMLLAQSRPEHN